MAEGTPIRPNVASAQVQYPTYHTNVLEDLQFEHETSLRTFEEFKAAASNARIQPFAVLKAELRKHMEAEEEVFYPAVAELGEDQSDLVDTAVTEHTAIKNALDTIETAGAENASGGNVTTLETALKNHIKAERAGIFRAARKGLTASQLRHLAALLGDKELVSELS